MATARSVCVPSEHSRAAFVVIQRATFGGRNVAQHVSPLTHTPCSEQEMLKHFAKTLSEKKTAEDTD